MECVQCWSACFSRFQKLIDTHVYYCISYFSNQLPTSSDRGDNPDPKRLSILFKSCSLNGRSEMWTDSLGISSWTLRQKFGFQFPAALWWPQHPILEPFHPPPKTKLCLSFPTWWHPASDQGSMGRPGLNICHVGLSSQAVFVPEPPVGLAGAFSDLRQGLMALPTHILASSSFCSLLQPFLYPFWGT